MTAITELREALSRPESDWRSVAAHFASHLPKRPGAEQARHRMVTRLAKALAADDPASASDLAPLLRQVVCSHGQSLTLAPSLFDRIGLRLSASGLRPGVEDSDGIPIFADEWKPSWLDDVSSMDDLDYRRREPTVLGDGMTQRVVGYPTYQSDAQKAAVLSCLFAPQGSTTLVTLPTGSGKSLCAQLPAWMETRGGAKAGGTTLLVVPTVALAADQERQARALFTGTRSGGDVPQAWLGDSDPESRRTMKQGLRDGTIPLLITSPEALMSGQLGAACIEAANLRGLTRLVIDEAHLIESWGASFRTDFQLLAALQRKLLDASQNQIRTVLLSATVSRSCERLLRRLFDQGTGYQAVQANRLRPEPGLWFSEAPSWEVRQDRVVEALRFAPRPAIVYMTRPEDAIALHNHLRLHEGYQRTATFSGETGSTERQRINRAWQADTIDIMVATSAFGLGVDKPDVRTVIHATLPENTNRYYQEVGRAGRDGCSAFTLLCTAPSDTDLASGLTSKSVITTETALDRVRGLQKSAVMDERQGNRLVIDPEAPPASKPTMRRSERSREWNEHVLLMLQRAGVLRIVDARIDFDEVTAQRRFLLELEIYDHNAFRDLDSRMRDLLDRARTEERETLDLEASALLQLARAQLNNTHVDCVGYDFAGLYPGCSLACGGCPSCRRFDRPPYLKSCRVSLDIADVSTTPAAIAKQLAAKLGPGRRAIVTWEGHRDIGELRPITPLLVRLAVLGMKQFVLPGDLADDERWHSSFIKALSDDSIGEHLVIDDTWVGQHSERPVFPLPTVVLYPVHDERADALHRAIERRSMLTGQPTISIVHNDLTLRCLGGRFRDKQDGLTQRWETFARDLEPPRASR
jgi:ATP-dependent DNA helicase RecQ